MSFLPYVSAVRSLSCVMVLALAGCSSIGSVGNKAPEDLVRERAQAWADAASSGDWRLAYTYTSPGYRQTATAGRYHAQIAGARSWLSATVRDVECVESSCKVTFILEYKAREMDMIIRRPRQYTWVESEGQWWLYIPA